MGANKCQQQQQQQHVPDSSVVERRLRPIYDWLDNANNKKALQECDKVLRKIPNLQCAKALKALAVHRMGRDMDAICILSDLVAEQPTDDATLQAMALCYKELQQLRKICELYETAVKLEPYSEELYTNLFMSYVRVGDFQKQQHSAMALFKFKAKTPYYCWAVMSIVLQATRGHEARLDSTKRTVLFSLAERMMEKLISEQRLDAEQELQLYVLVLELQAKYEQILRVLSGPLGEKLTCSNSPVTHLGYLSKLERWEEVVAVAKTILTGDSIDLWNVWKLYLNAIVNLANTKPVNDNDNNNYLVDCRQFINALINDNNNNNSRAQYRTRGPLLARLELLSQYRSALGMSCGAEHDLNGLYIEYFERFGNRSCCVSDLKPYLCLLTVEERTKLAAFLMQEVSIVAEATHTLAPSCHQMQRHLSAVQLARLCGAHRTLTVAELKALVTVFTLHYQHGYEQFGAELLSTNLGPSDAYAVLAAHVLFDIAKRENSTESIIGALSLLEGVMTQTPSNFHVKLLLIRLYHSVGGTLGAHQWYLNLDTKFLQLDSLGYMHAARLAAAGLYSICASLFDDTLRFFTSNYRESCDHLTFSYKYGSFIKLEEFMDFRERLYNSVHYTMISIDRIVLNVMENAGGSLRAILQVDTTIKDGSDISWELLRDNSDYSAYISYDPERVDCVRYESCREIATLHRQNLIYLQLRTYIIRSISTAIQIVQKNSCTNEKEQIKTLRKILADWKQLYSTTRVDEVLICPVPQNSLANAPLQSRLCLNLKLPTGAILWNLWDMFLLLTAHSPESNSSNSEDLIIDGLRENYDQMLDVCKEFTNAGVISVNLFQRRDCLEVLVNCVELLSFSTVLVLLCYAQQKQQQQVIHRRRKQQSKTSQTLRQIVFIVLGTIETLLRIMSEWMSSYEFTDVSKLLDALNLKTTVEALAVPNSIQNGGENSPTTATKVRENIFNSYTFACRELNSVLTAQVKVLKSLLE